MTIVQVKPTRAFSDELLDRYRQTDASASEGAVSGDPPADAAIAALVAEGGREGLGQLMRWLADTANFHLAGQHPLIQQFIAEHNQLPPWADRTRMQRGMTFFKKHAGAIGLILGTFSLPYTYLGANGVQVLWLTERIKNDTARRLEETGEWVFAVNDSKNWLASPSGEKAILYTLKIRLIHAASRWFARHTGRWNEAWGTPICQEDMVGTIGAFSYIVLQGLRKMGVAITEQEEEDYLHHINVVGYINGVAEELLPQNMREAYQLDRQISRRQFAPTEAGRGLTKSLLDAIEGISGTKSSWARNLAAAQMRFFLGDDHADALGIPVVPLEQSFVNVVSRLSIFPRLIPTR